MPTPVAPLLKGYVPAAEFARKAGVHRVTASRYLHEAPANGLVVVRHAGRCWVLEASISEWFGRLHQADRSVAAESRAMLRG